MKQGNKSEVRMNHDEAVSEHAAQTPLYQTKSSRLRNRAIGLTLLLVLFAAFWVYGWAGEIKLTQATTQPNNFTSQGIYGKLLILGGVFTVIGFGLLLAYYKHMGAVALLISLFVVSFTVITSPLVSKFWYNVFITDFQGTTITSDNSPKRFYQQSFSSMTIFLDLYNLKVAFANSISQLVVLLGVFGRLNIIQVVLNTILYNVAWNLLHFLCVLVQYNGPDSRVYDDYQIANVYLFAACYALVVSFFLKESPRKSFSHNSQSIILALVGTFFIFLSFCVTSTIFPLKFTPGQAQYARSYIWQQGFISTFFALSGSVIFSCAGSIVFNGFGGKLGIRQCVFGTITGGIIFGSVAGTAVNIGAAIASGLFAGLISSFSYKWVYRKMNQKRMYDTYGVTNVLFVSFFGTFAIAPVILIAYYNLDWILTTLSVSNFDKVGLPLINKSIVGWILSYVGISMGIGLVAGTIVGILLRCFISDARGHNQDYFTLHYGLSPFNPQSFQQDFPLSTEFKHIVKIVKAHKAEKKSVINVLEITEIKRSDNTFKTAHKEVIDVQVHGKSEERVCENIQAEVKSRNINAKVTWEEASIFRGQDVAISGENPKKFKAIYYLIKSRGLQQALAGSSLHELRVETSEHSFGGTEKRRVGIKAIFEKNDHGVDYLNFLKRNYEDLSLQTTIRT